MTDYAAPVLFAMFVWWFSTGAIIWLDGLSRWTFKWSMAAATVVAGLGFWGLARSAGGVDVSDAYLAFASALAIWAWLEMSFYMGWVTGLQRHRCPHGCSGLRHFGHALRANIWHELAILAFGAVVVAIAWAAPNQTGLWTFAILWWMHESARLNVFLGVQNLNEHFVPPHLEFLKGFLRKADMNLLFPVSVTVSTVACTFLAIEAIEAGSQFDRAGAMFLATMMTLAIVEHWFLILPLPFEKLWSWSLGSRRKNATRSMPRAVEVKPRRAAA